LPSPDFAFRPPDFDKYYELVRTDLSGQGLYPVTGLPRSIQCLYIKRPSVENSNK
jgi:hypothetical protein